MNGLTIGNVAKQAQVNIETLRYYERQGVVPQPRARVQTIGCIQKTQCAAYAS